MEKVGQSLSWEPLVVTNSHKQQSHFSIAIIDASLLAQFWESGAHLRFMASDHNWRVNAIILTPFDHSIQRFFTNYTVLRPESQVWDENETLYVESDGPSVSSSLVTRHRHSHRELSVSISAKLSRYWFLAAKEQNLSNGLSVVMPGLRSLRGLANGVSH